MQTPSQRKEPNYNNKMKIMERGSEEHQDDCTTSIQSAESTVDSRILDCMLMSSEMMSAEFRQAEIVSLHTSRGNNVKVLHKKSVNEAIQENTGIYGSICFVVRRPGCGLCREEGWTLSALTTLAGKPFDGFGLFGIVKEIGVDDKGLANFQSFFPYPLYRDDDMAFYKAFGSRRLQMKLANPVAVSKKARKIWRRLKRKNIETNFKGEGFTQGGIIFFGPEGKPMYAYEEQTGNEIPVHDILTVLDSIRAECSLGSQ